ncbi:Helix-turn-helix domain [Bifidobacterium longum]|jgi:hypothetical protein|nr:Helix-turn-helix domain [Bifidobacterium longum]
MNTDDFGEIAFTPRRYDDTARYLGLSPDSVRRWSTTAVMYSRIGMRIGSLIHAIAMESGASEAFIRENATQGRLHYLHTKRIPKEHIVELLTMTIIQEQMDFDGDSIRHAPCTFNITFFNAAWIPYIFWSEARTCTADSSGTAHWISRTAAARRWQVSEATLRGRSRAGFLTSMSIGGTVLHRVGELYLNFPLRQSR